MAKTKYLLDTNICIYWLRNRHGIKIENWIDDKG